VNVLKKIAVFLLKIIVSILLLTIGYLFAAIVLTIIPVNSAFKKNNPSETEIYVSSNGVHTDIIVPSESQVINWNHFLKWKTNYQYIAFGWGDKEFYMNTPTWADLKLRTAFKAAFLFDDAVLQVHGYSSKLKESNKTIKINLTQEQLNTLNDYIFRSFVINDLTLPTEVDPEKNSNSNLHYYDANRKYSIFFTCNNWTSKGLKRAGIKNSVWAPFDWSVLYYLK
jgi:uncharacterized protein (TIGR02117 family)